MSDYEKAEIKRARDRRRIERMRAAREIGTHSKSDWASILEKHGNKCAMCGICAVELIGGQLTKDHIVPVSQGGSDAPSNLQPLCRNCNTEKHQASR